MELPPCFRPNRECRALLERVKNNHIVTMDEAQPYVDAGFIERVFPLGFVLTATGHEALNR